MESNVNETNRRSVYMTGNVLVKLSVGSAMSRLSRRDVTFAVAAALRSLDPPGAATFLPQFPLIGEHDINLSKYISNSKALPTQNMKVQVVRSGSFAQLFPAKHKCSKCLHYEFLCSPCDHATLDNFIIL